MILKFIIKHLFGDWFIPAKNCFSPLIQSAIFNMLIVSVFLDYLVITTVLFYLKKPFELKPNETIIEAEN